jgi:CheY-like chemotaxis protein
VQFDQILLNLAGNARDAMPGGGRLTLSIAHTGPCRDERCPECVRLTVTDTGEGMEPATLARIFDPFFTTKDVGQGTGLGLSTCYAIVNEAGGTIRAESSVGRGTSVVLDLPACNEPVVDLAGPGAQDPQGHGERVLVVEDDAALRKAAVRILETAGYRVLEASDGEEAIEKMDDPGTELDLIITDVVMPRRGGFAVLAHARRRFPNTRVLLTSGYLDGSGGSEVIAGDSPLLWKPYTRSSLLQAAHDVLGETASQRGRPAADARARDPEPVLLIEDEEAIAAATRRMLARAGYQVTVATTMASARQLLEQDGPYAAVICDLTLPDGSGAELVSWLQHTHPEQARRVIVVTGGAVDEPGRALAAGGTVGFLQKPIDSRQLLHSVRTVAATWQAVNARSIP